MDSVGQQILLLPVLVYDRINGSWRPRNVTGNCTLDLVSAAELSKALTCTVNGSILNKKENTIPSPKSLTLCLHKDRQTIFQHYCLSLNKNILLCT